MTVYLYPLYLLMVFCECIVLLNILIAVMNDSFFRNNIVVESTKRIQQLEFVVDNWWVQPFAGKQHPIVYLVAAFSMDNENQTDEKLEVLQDQVMNLTKKNEEILNEIRKMKKA